MKNNIIYAVIVLFMCGQNLFSAAEETGMRMRRSGTSINDGLNIKVLSMVGPFGDELTQDSTPRSTALSPSDLTETECGKRKTAPQVTDQHIAKLNQFIDRRRRLNILRLNEGIHADSGYLTDSQVRHLNPDQQEAYFARITGKSQQAERVKSLEHKGFQSFYAINSKDLQEKFAHHPNTPELKRLVKEYSEIS